MPELNPPPAPARQVWKVGTLVYTSAGLTVLFCWLLAGDFAWSMKERSVTWVVQLLLKNFEASDMLVGLLIGTLPHGLAMILTPVVSYLSDRHRGRWGRRIPFLAIPTPVAALSIVGLAFSPVLGGCLHRLLGGASPGLNTSILVTFAVFWTLFELATVVANAVFFALINDVVPPTVLGRFYGMFRATGLIVAMIFNFWLLGKAETHYLWIFVGIGAVYGVGFTGMCFKVKEGEYPPPEITAAPRGILAAARTYARECFTRPYYLWIYASIALSWMAINAFNLFNIFFAKHVQMSLDVFGRCLAITYLISFFLSYFIGTLADRLHPLRLSLGAMALLALACLGGGLFARDSRSFAIALVACGVISGSWQTASASLTMRLFPRGRFAQFDSARGFVMSLGMMLVGPVMGRFLDLTGREYRYTYLAGAGLAALAVVTGLVAHRNFMRLGGPDRYVAPE